MTVTFSLTTFVSTFSSQVFVIIVEGQKKNLDKFLLTAESNKWRFISTLLYILILNSSSLFQLQFSHLLLVHNILVIASFQQFYRSKEKCYT